MIQRTLRTGCEFYVRTWGWFSVRSSHSKVSIGSHCENRSENRVSIWEPPNTRVLLCLLILGSFCGYKISSFFNLLKYRDVISNYHTTQPILPYTHTPITWALVKRMVDWKANTWNFEIWSEEWKKEAFKSFELQLVTCNLLILFFF